MLAAVAPIRKRDNLSSSIKTHFKGSYQFHVHSHFQCTPRLDPNQPKSINLSFTPKTLQEKLVSTKKISSAVTRGQLDEICLFREFQCLKMSLTFLVSKEPKKATGAGGR